ncbi:MAG: hypothetical protein ACREPL_04275 [Rhodanobacteraceae bacterium]
MASKKFQLGWQGAGHRFIVASVVLGDPGTFGTAARVEARVDGDPERRIGLYLTRHGGVVLQNLAGWRIETDVERLGYTLAVPAGSASTRWWTEPRARRLVESWVAYVRAHAAAIYALGAVASGPGRPHRAGEAPNDRGTAVDALAAPRAA